MDGFCVNMIDLRFLRIRVFYTLLSPFSARARGKRMREFSTRMAVEEAASVIDLGGQPMIWSGVDTSLKITILNLPGIVQIASKSHHQIEYVVGDACEVTGYKDASFDIVFSNSVIEHVGDRAARAKFAREVQRLGRAYWVQTPCKYFPIEPHNGMPFWWFYPKALREAIIARWKKKLPEWTEMIEGTDIVSRRELETLFPGGVILVERFLGLPKSYIVYRGPLTLGETAVAV